MPRRLSVHHQTHKKFEKLKSLSESIESELSLIERIERIQRIQLEIQRAFCESYRFVTMLIAKSLTSFFFLRTVSSVVKCSTKMQQ
jgi:hypothetical protein